MDRYQVAPPSVAAVIHAAMDARRADHDPDIPAALLAKAAPAYMTSAQLAMASDHWWEEALDYAVQPCNGIPGLLVPAYRLTRSAANKRPPAAGRPAYRLADCLDQYGRIRRADCLPPHGFWEAMAAHARLDRPSAAPDLLHALRRFAPDQAEVLLSRDPTADVDLTREFPGSLMRKLRRARKDDQVRALAQRLIDYPLLKLEELEDAAMNLLHELHQEAQVVAWCDFHIETDGELDPDWAALWMFQLQRIGASKHADAVAGRIVSHGRLHDPFEVAKILWNLQWYELLRRKGHRPGEGMAVQLLVQLTEEAKYSTNEMVKAVLDRDPASQVDLINPLGLRVLLEKLRKVEASGQIEILADRIASDGNISNPDDARMLLNGLKEAGMNAQLKELGARTARGAEIDDPHRVKELLWWFHEAGMDAQAKKLASRMPKGASRSKHQLCSMAHAAETIAGRTSVER